MPRCFAHRAAGQPNLALRRRSAFAITETELKLIAAAQARREALSCQAPPSSLVQIEQLVALARRRHETADPPGDGRDTGEETTDILAQRTLGLLQASVERSGLGT